GCGAGGWERRVGGRGGWVANLGSGFSVQGSGFRFWFSVLGSRFLRFSYTARMSRLRAVVSFSVGLVLVAGGVRGRIDAQTAGALDPSVLGNLRWRSIGPANTGGRIDDFAVARVPGPPD